MAEKMIECENLVKIYKTKDLEVMALQGLDLVVERGELMGIIGNSGSGKSTFLNMIGGLDRPSAGRLSVAGKNLFKMTNAQLEDYKQNTVGFVWQNNARNLFPYLTAIDNIKSPMLFRRMSEKARNERATMLLEMVGMSHKKHSKLNQLSGGEQQRIAIAIALANEPELLLADEPTGAVDVSTSYKIFEVFRELNEQLGLTIVIVTHDRNFSKMVKRVVSIRDGKTSSESIMKKEFEEEWNQTKGFLNEEESHEEFAVLDKTGRLQIPGEMLEELGLNGNKVQMEMKDGNIIIKSPE